MTKREIIEAISNLLNIEPDDLGPGSKEHRQFLVDAATAVGLPVDDAMSKVTLARRIATLGGQSWDGSCDSMSRPSGGGDTVTTEGLRRVLESCRCIVALGKPQQESLWGHEDGWSRDELLLLLDVAQQVPTGDLPRQDVEAVLVTLEKLARQRPELEGRLTVDAVCSKIEQLRQNKSRGIAAEFADRTIDVSRLATAIKKALNEPSSELIVDVVEVEEGQTLYARHRSLERDMNLVFQKKLEAATSGTMSCEACGFSFGVTYGEPGSTYIECHHVRPLYEVGPSVTTLDDLVLLCANCHRMVHYSSPRMTLEDLKAKFRRTADCVPPKEMADADEFAILGTDSKQLGRVPAATRSLNS